MKLKEKHTLDVYDYFDDLVSITDDKNIIIYCNTSFCSFINKPKDFIIGKNESEIINLSNYNIKNPNDNYTYEQISLNTTLHYFKSKKIVSNEKKEQKQTITIRRNITKEEHISLLYEENKQILKDIAQDKEYITTLEDIILSAQKMNKDMKCSILLLDEKKEHLFSATAPSIPEFYTSKISGMKIGKKVGSCGAAAFLKKRVIVEDIQSHENWQLAKNLANKANLQACWSQPIFSSKGEVLGTFAMYYSTPKAPTKFDLYIIEDRANLAGIAIEKYNNEQKLLEKHQKEKEQEELLMHKTKQAMMGEMIENIAHQWRQPLSIISTSATGINLKKELGILTDEFEKKALVAINENAQYLSKTIDDFRNYFKSENILNKFLLKDTINKTLDLIDVLIKNKFIIVIKNIEEDIVLNNLENELIQVFMNIFNNSIDELERESIQNKYIYINCFKEDKHAVIKINDSAGGVKQNILNRIFEPYFTTKHQKHGTGIGLYMCKEMIEKHMKGTIQANNNTFEVNDSTYKGLEFTIKLPLN